MLPVLLIFLSLIRFTFFKRVRRLSSGRLRWSRWSPPCLWTFSPGLWYTLSLDQKCTSCCQLQTQPTTHASSQCSLSGLLLCSSGPRPSSRDRRCCWPSLQSNPQSSYLNYVSPARPLSSFLVPNFSHATSLSGSAGQWFPSICCILW